LQALEGSIISRYRLQKQIDSEGPSQSYLSVDRRTGRAVVMKLIPCGNDEDIAHLQGAIQELSELEHEHTLPILDQGKHDMWYYIVTPYSANKTLEQQLPNDALSPQDAGDILEEPAKEPAVSSAQKFMQQKALLIQNLIQRYKDKRLFVAAIAAAAIITLVSLFTIGVSSSGTHNQAAQQNRQASWTPGTINPSATISPTAQNKPSKKLHSKRARAINEQTYGEQPTVQPIMQPYSTAQPTVQQQPTIPTQPRVQPTVPSYPTSQPYPTVQPITPTQPRVQPTVQVQVPIATPTPSPVATQQLDNHGKGKGPAQSKNLSENVTTQPPLKKA
jgi:hypothetical protein